jgi:L-alanine-DL-glutamate epimerase-like enolase superfamily enzyme
MRIVDIRESTVPLASGMRNAKIDFRTMTASAIAIVTDIQRDGRPLVGLAFDSIGRYGHGGLLRERFIPRLLAAGPDDYADDARRNIDPFKIWEIVMRGEKPGGHGERSGAVGLIDAAVWDLVAKIEEKPLWLVLAERFRGGNVEPRIPTYASGGHYRPDGDLAGLAEEIRGYRDLGYRRVKIKIGGAPLDEDRRRIEAVLAVVGSGDDLAVDCNGTFGREQAVATVTALEPYKLAWIEEPVEPLDYELHRELRADMSTPLATGENVFSSVEVRNLLRYAGLNEERDLLQMDVSLSYGIVEYLAMLALIEAQGWSRTRCLPHAGHLLSLNVAAGLGLGGHESAPDAASIFGGYPEGATVADGFVSLPDAIGAGIERKDNLYAVFRDLVAS